MSMYFVQLRLAPQNPKNPFNYIYKLILIKSSPIKMIKQQYKLHRQISSIFICSSINGRFEII